MEKKEAERSALEFSPDEIFYFEPVSGTCNVFYDEANQQIFCVRAGGASGVVVRGPRPSQERHFIISDKGPIQSIKFSPDQRILALQRSPTSVELINFSVNNQPDSIEYSQSCRGKSNRILAFYWLSSEEVVFVTEQDIEHYQIFPDKRTLRSSKTVTVSIHWSQYLPSRQLLVASSGPLGNLLHPFAWRQGQCQRLTKFEVDLVSEPRPPRVALLERDCLLTSLYEDPVMLVVRHPNQSQSEVVVFRLQQDCFRRLHVLHVPCGGRIALSLIDHLVVVHVQTTKSSLFFDTAAPGSEDKFMSYHRPLIEAMPVPAVTVNPPTLSAPRPLELYASTCAHFPPNIVIDVRLGCLAPLKLNLAPFVAKMDDRVKLVDFLLRRREKEGKSHLTGVCEQLVTTRNIDVLGKVFDCLNRALATRSSSTLDQSDMYGSVFLPCEERVPPKSLVAIVVEYIRSLDECTIPVQHLIFELLVNLLVRQKSFAQLHQFLQYHVVTDSKPTACLLLSLSGNYPPAHQLALDMLKRLHSANDEIIEVLLSENKILEALRFLRSVGLSDQVPARKFLEAAKATEDPFIFFHTYRFFEQRNIRVHGMPRFTPNEHCHQFEMHYQEMFNKA